MKISILVLLLMGCAIPQPKPQRKPIRPNPILQKQYRIDKCIHRFIDKGINFEKAVDGCSKHIYFEMEGK